MTLPLKVGVVNQSGRGYGPSPLPHSITAVYTRILAQPESLSCITLAGENRLSTGFYSKSIAASQME